MTKTIYLKSQIPCVIQYLDNETLIGNPEQFATIKLDNTMYIKFYPINEDGKHNYLSQLVTLNPKALPQDNLVITKFDEFCYEASIIPTKVATTPPLQQKQDITVGLEKLSVNLTSSTTSTITISNQEVLFCHYVDFELTNLDVTICNEYIQIQCDYMDKKYLLIVDYQNFAIVHEKVFDMIEFDEQVLKGFLKQEDMAKHGLIVSFDFSTRPVKIETKTVYVMSRPQTTNNPLLIPFAFFEAVQIKNFKLARHYLNSTLSNKLDNNHLQQFFGDFLDIRQNVYNKQDNLISLIYGNNNNYYVKNYKCEMQNNLICNIIQA